MPSLRVKNGDSFWHQSSFNNSRTVKRFNEPADAGGSVLRNIDLI